MGADYRRAAIRALRLQHALIDLKRIWGKAEIPFFALKGAWLAQHIYLHPALRPMRDIDVLVRANQAAHAYAVLLDNGYV